MCHRYFFQVFPHPPFSSNTISISLNQIVISFSIYSKNGQGFFSTWFLHHQNVIVTFSAPGFTHTYLLLKSTWCQVFSAVYFVYDHVVRDKLKIGVINFTFAVLSIWLSFSVCNFFFFLTHSRGRTVFRQLNTNAVRYFCEYGTGKFRQLNTNGVFRQLNTNRVLGAPLQYPEYVP